MMLKSVKAFKYHFNKWLHHVLGIKNKFFFFLITLIYFFIQNDSMSGAQLHTSFYGQTHTFVHKAAPEMSV